MRVRPTIKEVAGLADHVKVPSSDPICHPTVARMSSCDHLSTRSLSFVRDLMPDLPAGESTADRAPNALP